ncbi:MAG TPA: GNAT family N-acetyltransferase [Hyphomicrobiaceae bacterium]|nr:GNAT family N-acetyltransferase [Hyphomicrobiaceae bacterium]
MTFVNDAIRTERLLLRPLRPGDAEPLRAQFASWEVVRWLGTPPWPYTLDDARSFIALQLGREPAASGYLAITLDDALIGGVEAGGRDAAGAASGRSPTLGYWLTQPHWGHGYMTEAAGAYIARIFAATAVDTIYSGAFVGNEASLRVQDKLGFERTGDALVYCRPRDAKLAHVNTQLTRSRFLAGCR